MKLLLELFVWLFSAAVLISLLYWQVRWLMTGHPMPDIGTFVFYAFTSAAGLAAFFGFLVLRSRKTKADDPSDG